MKKILCSLAFVVLLTSCRQYNENRNEEASLPQSFDFENLDLITINSIINPSKKLTSTLFGNKEALQQLKLPAGAINKEKVLVLITWKQHDDPRWFGAKTPSDLRMIEVVKAESGFADEDEISYEKYDARGQITPKDNGKDRSRIKFITSIIPAVMP